MNWTLLSPPPLSSDPDNPPKLGTCTYKLVDLLQVPLEYTQHKFKIVGMNSDADV